MSNIDKQALREAAERAKDSFIPSFRAPTRDVLALLDENIQLQRGKDATEAVALALRDDMRQAREQLEAAERRIAEQSAIVAAAEKLVRCKGRYHSELNYRALAKLFGVITPDLPPLEHENVQCADAAEALLDELEATHRQVGELTMWVKRLAYSLRNAKPNSKLHGAAMDYLSRKGLISVEDVLR
ncbi:ead/Ea22-like family protein [Salmonella enterica subsp. houtenae]|nr:ead/Ea22-like family protein [Salmonella enterica subsp. houtenae]